jgi:hypothetical protein
MSALETLKNEWLRVLDEEIQEECSDSSQREISQQEIGEVLVTLAQKAWPI